MCGRFALSAAPEIVRAAFGYADEPWFPPRYNIAPTQPIAIVTGDRDGAHRLRRFELVRWGYVPAFVKDFGAAKPTFNAWCEGLPDRPAFRNAFRRRRCLVLADAWYVWQARGGQSQPWLVRRADRQTFGMAGLREPWAGADGSEIDTACIVTAPASGAFAGLHPRRPVVIAAEQIDRWLDPDETRAADAVPLLDVPPDHAFEAVPIGPAVNKAANDVAAIQEPIGPVLPLPVQIRSSPQGELF